MPTSDLPRDDPRGRRRTGLPGPWVERQGLAGDASSRRYERLVDDTGATSILVTYPEGAGAVLERDLEATRWLAGHGVAVPRLLWRDPSRPRALLEDVGRVDAEGALCAMPTGQRLAAALPLLGPLAALAAIPPDSLPPFNPPLDLAALRWELAGFELWCLSLGAGPAPDAETARWLDHLAARAAAHPVRVCHRDYHLNNLFLTDRRRPRVIDAQDVRLGPDTYDLASLLGERAMPDLLSSEDQAAMARTWAETTNARPGWRARWRVVRLQRGLKVLGTFARLGATGREGYASWLARLAEALLVPAREDNAPDAILEALRRLAAEES